MEKQTVKEWLECLPQNYQNAIKQIFVGHENHYKKTETAKLGYFEDAMSFIEFSARNMSSKALRPEVVCFLINLQSHSPGTCISQLPKIPQSLIDEMPTAIELLTKKLPEEYVNRIVTNALIEFSNLEPLMDKCQDIHQALEVFEWHTSVEGQEFWRDISNSLARKQELEELPYELEDYKPTGVWLSKLPINYRFRAIRNMTKSNQLKCLQDKHHDYANGIYYALQSTLQSEGSHFWADVADWVPNEPLRQLPRINCANAKDLMAEMTNGNTPFLARYLDLQTGVPQLFVKGTYEESECTYNRLGVKLQTVVDFITHLPSKYYREATDELLRQRLDKEISQVLGLQVDCLEHALRQAFDWYESKLGYDFWNDVAHWNGQCLADLPIIPKAQDPMSEKEMAQIDEMLESNPPELNTSLAQQIIDESTPHLHKSLKTLTDLQAQELKRFNKLFRNSKDKMIHFHVAHNPKEKSRYKSNGREWELEHTLEEQYKLLVEDIYREARRSPMCGDEVMKMIEAFNRRLEADA